LDDNFTSLAASCGFAARTTSSPGHPQDEPHPLPFIPSAFRNSAKNVFQMSFFPF